MIIFDLEATGLDVACNTVQIAVCRLTDPMSVFSRYVLPTKPISSDASRVTQLGKGRTSGAEALLHNDDPVSAEVLGH